jgi:nitroreductase
VDFRDVLTRRRSVRTYADRPVPRDVLERIASAAVVWAPSAGFSQGLRIVVVTDAGTRRSIATAAKEDALAALGRPRWKAAAPVHMVVLTREDDYHDRYRKADKLHDGEEIQWPVPYWFVDAGAALMLLLLAAVDEGLAAGVSGVPLVAAAELRSTFGIPDDVSVIALVTIGQPAPDPGWSAVTSRRTQPRRSPVEVIHWGRWT